MATNAHAVTVWRDQGSASIPALALARTRQRHYAPRTAATAAIVERLPALINDLPVIPTLRQVFYLLVSENVIEKTEKAYKALSRQLSSMRKGGMLPYNALADGTRQRRDGWSFNGAAEAIRYAAGVYRVNAWDTQPQACEVWAEADTMSAVLTQIADPYNVPVVVTKGQSSLTYLWRSADKIGERWTFRQPTRILYVGDFDPAGMDMSDALHERLCEVGAPEYAFSVQRVALTREQIDRYQLLERPPKEKDSRAKKFVEHYGSGCVEVDALPPNVLVSVMQRAIAECITEVEAWKDAVWEQEHMKERLLYLAEDIAEADSDGGGELWWGVDAAEEDDASDDAEESED